jgi:carboxylate-amine ligase
VPIDFAHNERHTVGAEMELHIIDLASGELVPATSGLLLELGVPELDEDRLEGEAPPEHPRIKHELFESTIEIISEVGDTSGDVGEDLMTTLDQVAAKAASHGLGLIGAGTHPFALLRDAALSPDPRYARLIEDFQFPLRRLAVCGLHVHVAVGDGDRAIRVMNELSRHLPVLLALSASSPFVEGEDSGLASARIKLFEMLPNSGLPPRFDDWADFELFMDTLTRARCIESIKDVWWAIRPQPGFGTIEIRVCDTPSRLDDLVAIVGLVQCLVASIDRRIDDGTLAAPPPEWMVEENMWLATRYGTSAELVTDDASGGRTPIATVAADLVESLAAVAEEHDADAALAHVGEIFATGNSADRQRGLVADGGTLLDVVRHLADELVPAASRRP